MDLDGEEPIQEDDEDKMGCQESTKDPGMLGGVDGAVSWEFYLHLLTHFKPTLNPFRIVLPGFPERDCKVPEVQRGAKVIMNKVLIKLVVPKKDLDERWEQIPPRESQPYKEGGCVRPVMALPEGLSLGHKVRKDALIANPEEFGAIGTMSPSPVLGGSAGNSWND